MEYDEIHLPVILSPEGSAEVEEELKHGTPMTPGRRAMLELARAREATWTSDAALDEERAKKKG